MKKWVGPALLLAIAAVFLVLNKGAYKGFFQDDELDNIINGRDAPISYWLETLATPRLLEANVRPVGHSFFEAMNNLAGLDFPKYVVPVHLLHLLNMTLLWLLLRRLGLDIFAASAGAAFFALNVAAFDAYWKPMYIFDIFCTTFCLLAILLYAHGRWILSLVAMWFAYKSKELAVMLPLVLSAYEFWIGEKRWKRLIPFFLISLLFGIQALIHNSGMTGSYAFVFTPESVWSTITFYSSRLLLLPFAGLAFIFIPKITNDRRIWLGATMLGAFFLPLLFLPGRVYPAYCYLPLTGAAVEIAALSTLVPPWWILVFFAAWLPWNIRELRVDRRATLTADDEARPYVTGIQEFARKNPEPRQFAFTQLPAGFHLWGLRAAVIYAYHRDAAPLFIEEEKARKLASTGRVTFLNWDSKAKRLFAVTQDPAVGDASYIEMNGLTPIWQLDEGWFGLDAYFRWIAPRATAHLSRPPDVKHFELTVNMGQPTIDKYHGSSVHLILNGQDLGAKQFDAPGIHIGRWDLPPAEAGPAFVELRAAPEIHIAPDPRTLGVAITAFGFKS
jgi:hypothetical protein